jgi:hypothetical protein
VFGEIFRDVRIMDQMAHWAFPANEDKRERFPSFEGDHYKTIGAPSYGGGFFVAVYIFYFADGIIFGSDRLRWTQRTRGIFLLSRTPKWVVLRKQPEW